MKKIIAAIAFLAGLAMPALGQVTNPVIFTVSTAPSGACAAGLPNEQVYSTGTQYSCQSVTGGTGTWGAIGGGPPTGTAGGDLSGTYPNPGVAQVNGAVVPTSALYVASNSSKQLVAATTPLLPANNLSDVGSTTTAKANLLGNTLGCLDGYDHLPCTTGVDNLTAQTANLTGSHVIYSVPSGGAGTYRVGCYVILTTAATTSSTLPQCTVRWVDAETSVVESIQVSNSNTGNTVGLVAQGSGGNAYGSILVHAAAASNIIDYTQSYASSGATAMQYSIHSTVEYVHP